MNREAIKANFFAVVGLGIAGVMLLVVLLAPLFQASRIQVNSEVQLHLEKARRLLAQYDAQLSVDSDLREMVKSDSGQASEMLDQLIQQPPTDFDPKVQGDAEMAAYAELPEVKKLADAEREMLVLQYGEEKWQEHASPAPPSKMGGGAMAREGSAHYEKQLASNAKLFEQALAEVNEALNIAQSSEDTQQHASANRLLGIIHFQQGLADVRKAVLLRQQLQTARFSLRQQAIELAAVLEEQKAVEQSGIDAEITSASELEAQARLEVQEQSLQVTELRTRVKELSDRIAEAAVRSEAAREAMEALQDVGVDLSNSQGFEEFKSAYESQSKNYRAAIMEAHVLQHGTLGNAAIDYTGDYIQGRYQALAADQDILFERGLVYYQQDLERMEAELERLKEKVSQLEENVQSLRKHKENLENQAKLAVQFVSEKTQELTGQFNDFKTLDAAVRSQEDQAIALFNKASGAFKTALAGVNHEEAQANEDQPQNPERQLYHYSALAGKQDWLKGHIIAQQADADFRVGLILTGRYQDAQANLSDLSSLGSAMDIASDVKLWEETAKSQKGEAIKIVEGVVSALQEKAMRQIGDGNWTVAGEIGAAEYALSLLGVELAAEKALEWYRVALEGREVLAPDMVAMREFITLRMSSETHSPIE